jgi:hypothetical protein
MFPPAGLLKSAGPKFGGAEFENIFVCAIGKADCGAAFKLLKAEIAGCCCC